MVQTITPVVHGGRRRRWIGTVLLHVVGATTAAALFGAVLGAVGGLLGGPFGRAGGLLVATVALLYAARELFRLPVPLPELRRQVPEWWRGWLRPQPVAFLYGLGLGVGFLTHLRHGTLVAVSAAAVVLGDPVLGAVAVAPFGFARAIGVAVAWRARSEEAAGELGEGLERIGATALPRLANGAALATIATAAVVTSLPDGRGVPRWLAAAVVAAVFGWAALAKALGPHAWLRALGAYGLPSAVRGAAAVGVALAESAVAIAFVAGPPTFASAMALGLLAAFSLAVLRGRALHGDRLPCGCFGSSARRDWRSMLARNIALAGLAAIAFVQRANVPLPTARDPLPAVLTAVGVILVVLLVGRASDALRQDRRPAPISTT